MGDSLGANAVEKKIFPKGLFAEVIFSNLEAKSPFLCGKKKFFPPKGVSSALFNTPFNASALTGRRLSR